MKQPLLQGNWKIVIQVSLKFDKICIFFCFQWYQNVLEYACKDLLDSAVEKNWLGAMARRGKAELSPPGNFYLSYMHSGVGLGKIFQRGVHESKHKIGIISLGSGSKSPAAGDDKGVWGQNPSV